MNLLDKWLHCVDCGQQFLWDAENRRGSWASIWGTGPNDAKNAATNAAMNDCIKPRAYTQVSCAQCGAPTYVPFVPRGTKPIYCRMCLTAVRV